MRRRKGHTKTQSHFGNADPYSKKKKKKKATNTEPQQRQLPPLSGPPSPQHHILSRKGLTLAHVPTEREDLFVSRPFILLTNKKRNFFPPPPHPLYPFFPIRAQKGVCLCVCMCALPFAPIFLCLHLEY